MSMVSVQTILLSIRPLHVAHIGQGLVSPMSDDARIMKPHFRLPLMTAKIGV